MVSVGTDMTMRMWDVATQREIKRVGTPKPRLLRDDAGISTLDSTAFSAASSLTISADGNYLAQGRVVWDIAKWQIVATMGPHPPRGVEPPPIYLFDAGVLTPDNKYLIVGGAARYEAALCGKLRIYDMVTGKQVFADRVFSNGTPVLGVAVSPDGRHALAAGSGAITRLDTISAVPRVDGSNLYVYRLPPPSLGASPHIDEEGRAPEKK